MDLHALQVVSALMGLHAALLLQALARKEGLVALTDLYALQPASVLITPLVTPLLTPVLMELHALQAVSVLMDPHAPQQPLILIQMSHVKKIQIKSSVELTTPINNLSPAWNSLEWIVTKQEDKHAYSSLLSAKLLLQTTFRYFTT